MSISTDALDHARAEAQALHKQLEEAATKNEAAMLERVHEATQRLSHAVAARRSEMAKAKS